MKKIEEEKNVVLLKKDWVYLCELIEHAYKGDTDIGAVSKQIRRIKPIETLVAVPLFAVKSFEDLIERNAIVKGYTAGATEERERGKRFNRWLNENYALYDEIDFTWLDKETNMDIKNIDQIFDQFLLVKKTLND